MNVDEAMEAAAEFRADMEARPAWTLFSETVAVVLAAEVERLRAELAAAKAASVVPVKIRELCADGHVGKLAAWCENADAAKQLHGWLRDRMKDNSPPAT